ncbi:hypothetical protein HGF60_12740, partial [Alteromonadaceae bacterium A_SAG2]|nr:hypothetical protein [Alteromonadaceae bacterium A_SAG2]
MKKLIPLFVLFALHVSSLKAEDTLVKEYSYDLMSHSSSDVLNPLGIDIDGVNVTLSAWADTATSSQTDVQWQCWPWACYPTQVTVTHDLDTVESATAQLVNGWGYGIRNDLESGGSHQTIDNYGESINGTFVDSFEYLLFSFDSEVNISQIDFGWHAGYDQQVSVVSIANSAEIESASWSSIVSNQTTLNAISASFNIVGSQNNGSANLQSLSNTYSNYWLVGAYNKTFGDIGGHDYNDAFKIS